MSRKRSRRPDRKPPESPSPPAASRRPLRLPDLPWWAVVLLAGLAAALLFADDLAFVLGNSQFLDHAGNPLLTAADGYHYLYLADAAQRVGAPGFALPGLSFLALQASDLLGADLLRTAFWIPPVLAALLGPAVALLARELGLSRGGALLAALLACAAPYWHARSNLGYFDTDCLIAPLVLLAGWAVLRFGLGGGARRWACLGLAAACLVLLRWWWGSSALPVAAGFAGAYAASIVAPSSRPERLAKAALLAGGLALAGLFALRHTLPAPGFLAGFFESAAAHLDLVVHRQAAPMQVGATIGELKAVGLAGLAEITVGRVWVLVPALAGLALLAARQWPRMLLLL
ncbi:MAG: STT3 domain-containing protein, partial [Thermodesulfobacteriota bacterium]